MSNLNLAQKIIDNQQLAASTQQALRNNRRVIRRSTGTDDDDDQTGGSPVPEAISNTPTPQSQPFLSSNSSSTTAMAQSKTSNVVPLPSPNTATTVSQIDMPTEHFSAGLDRCRQNRQLLMQWLRAALVEGVDYGPIHVVSRDRCQHARNGRLKDCADSSHWSKPCLFKLGAEKITGMLGLSVHYPSLPGYEAAVLAQVEISMIVMRCELRDANGHLVAEGVGARNLNQDYGDFNKALKMVEKSAHIDATLRLAGLSEMFTPEPEERLALIDNVEVTLANARQTSGPRPTTASVPPAPGPITTAPAPSQPPLRRESFKPKPSAPTVTRRTAVTPVASISASSPVPTSSSASSSAPLTSPTSATIVDSPARNDHHGSELVTKTDLAALRKAIADYGFTEERVLSWLFKYSNGSVTQFEQLSTARCSSLIKRIEYWAETEQLFASSASINTDQGVSV